MRKSSTAKKLAKEAAERAKECEQLAQLAIEEDLATIKETDEAIRALVAEKNLFCGVIITKDDLIALTRLMLDTQESVRINFSLYLTDNE